MKSSGENFKRENFRTDIRRCCSTNRIETLQKLVDVNILKKLNINKRKVVWIHN